MWNIWFLNSHYFLLSYQYIIFHFISIILILSISKIDQFHIDIEIYLAYFPHSLLCFIITLWVLFTHFPKPSQSPLFTHSYNQFFSKSFFIIKIRKLLLNTGIFIIDYSKHSLQKNIIIITNHNNIPKHNIKLLEW
jgi:hypothetical protein